MLAVLEAGLDFVNAVTEKKAAAKRLLKAQEQYGDTQLMAVRLGKQTMLLSKPLLDEMVRSGLWGLLQQAAERGDDVSTLS